MAAAQALPGQEILPIIPCPICGREIETYVCRKGTRPGVRFYKCCKFNDGVCRWFKWQDEYVGTLEEHGIHLGAAPEAPGQQAQQPAVQPQQPVPQAAAPVATMPAQPRHTGAPAPAQVLPHCGGEHQIQGGPYLVDSKAQAQGIPPTKNRCFPADAEDIARISLLVSVANLMATSIVLGVVIAAFTVKKF